MMKLLLSGLSLSFLCACGTAPEESRPAAVESKDSTTTLQNTPIGKFRAELRLPFTCDTSKLLHLDHLDSLSGQDVKWLSQDWFKNDLVRSIPFDLQTFYTIDSVKAIGKYQAYCDSLQIGQTRSANAYALGKIKVDEKTQLLVWALTSSSYEACPFSTSYDVYFTIVEHSEPRQSFLLGEYQTFADPPVGTERTVTGTLDKNFLLSLKVYQENDEDMDAPTITVTKEEHTFSILNGTIKTETEKKYPVQAVKRKKSS